MPGISSKIILLISPFSHPFAVNSMRGQLIIARVQNVARFFAIMTLCWIITDRLFFPQILWKTLAVERLAACVAFIVLGWIKVKPKLNFALSLMVMLYATVLAFLFFAVSSIHLFTPGILLSQYATIYYFSPFVLASSIGFFPLTLLEAMLLLVIPIIATTFLLADIFQKITSNGLQYSLLWILSLTLVSSAIVSISQIGLFMELFKNMAYDKLTGLFLRKMGEDNLKQHIASAIRNHLAFSIIFFDLDNFKKINDRFGHNTGDQVLSTTGEYLKHILREQDIAIRWGGEEFLIALPNTNKLQAEDFLKRFSQTGLGLTPDGNRITASFGVAEIKADQIKDFQALVALADKRLYEAKKEGKNRYIIQDQAQIWLN